MRPPLVIYCFAFCEVVALGAALPDGDPQLNSPALWVAAAVAVFAGLLKGSQIAWWLAAVHCAFWSAVSVLGAAPTIQLSLFIGAHACAFGLLLLPAMRSWVEPRPQAT